MLKSHVSIDFAHSLDLSYSRCYFSCLKWKIWELLVMFFMFPIFIAIFSLIPINSVILREPHNYKAVLYRQFSQGTLNSKDVTKRNSTSFATNKSLYQIIKNLTKTESPNLKSNVFEKMFSDEMYSIKRHFYEKDINTSLISIAAQNKASTPSLEIKQNWPMIQLFSRVGDNKKETDLKRDKENDIGVAKIKKNLKHADRVGVVKDKVLELRSLSEDTSQPQHVPCTHFQGTRLCTCMKTNPSTECSHRCTGGSSKMCTHIDREPESYASNILVTYYPYFVGVTTPSSYIITYYHPDIMNEMKFPKKLKNRKTTKAEIDGDLYYDVNRDETIDAQYDDEYLDDDNTKIPKVNDNTKRKNNLQILPLSKTVQKDETDTKKEHLMFNAMDDLKSYYKDSIMKDCYCSYISRVDKPCATNFSMYITSLVLLVLST